MILNINENLQVRVTFRHSYRADVTHTKTTTLKNGTKKIKVDVGTEYYSTCFITQLGTGFTLSFGHSVCSIYDVYDKRNAIWYSFRDALKNYQYDLNHEVDYGEKSLVDLFVETQPTIDKFIEEFSKYNKNKNFYRFFYNLPRELKPKNNLKSFGI